MPPARDLRRWRQGNGHVSPLNGRRYKHRRSSPSAADPVLTLIGGKTAESRHCRGRNDCRRERRVPVGTTI